ncbi:EamA family transporter [Thermogemmatispora sp.]|uniref:EamA family transporter n=1 Tax=Thermogemmatispora sp. TaxID=1968838 RepID=UPI001E016695|nr:DMT family transporter [Thermogemmatispora sp.]MBX5448439.1 DMT family transporter [Thermogemmatispora sp.]
MDAQGERRGRLWGYLLVVLASMLFGFNGNLARKLFDESPLTPLTLVECRMLIGGGCLLALLGIVQRGKVLPSRQSWGWLLALGLAMAAVTYSYFMAISRLPVAIALVIQFSTPAWLVLGEALWRRRWPSLPVLSSLLLAGSGIVLVTAAWQPQFLRLDGLGLLAAFFSVLSFAAYLLLGRRVGRELLPLSATAWGAIIAALFWLLVQPPWRIPLASLQPSLWPALLAVGILGMAVPFLCELAALRYLEAGRVGIVAMLELVAGSAIAYGWLGEVLTLDQLLGGVLVMLGVGLLHYEELRRPSGGASPQGRLPPVERGEEHSDRSERQELLRGQSRESATGRSGQAREEK